MLAGLTMPAGRITPADRMVLDTDAPDLSTIIYNARTADHTEALAGFMEDRMAVATDQADMGRVDMAHMGTTNIPGKKGAPDSESPFLLVLD